MTISSRTVPILPAVALLAIAPAATAAPMSYIYRTEGTVRPWNGPSSGLDGTLSITYRGVEDVRYTGPGTIALGEFVIAPPGQDTTYRNTFFGIGFEIPELARVIGPNQGGGPNQLLAEFGIFGRLNGRVFADGTADLTATIDFIETFLPNRGYPTWGIGSSLPFKLGDIQIGRELRLPTPIGMGGGSVAVTARVVPEPAPLAIFAVAGAGLILRRRSLWGRRPGD